MNILFVGDREDFFCGEPVEGSSDASFFFYTGEIADCIAQAVQNKNAPDAIVLPATAFFRLAAAIQGPERWPIPVLVSGHAEEMAEAFGCGCTDYLVIPFGPTEVVERVRHSALQLPGSAGWQLQGHTLMHRTGTYRLKHQEASLLRILLANRAAGIPRTALAALMDLPSDGRSLDMRIHRLRKTLQTACGRDAPDLPRAQKSCFRISNPIL
ncbi:MAG: hypothetical protein KKI09_08135 [Spirochaetes bacterium]|nr:hypothetical protein [Spirochaetota bacterium]MBU0955380.1 hypothetical protein [Spirochaetota bacterium]